MVLPAKVTTAPSIHEAPTNTPFRVRQRARPMAPSQNRFPSFLDRPADVSPNMDKRSFQRLLKGKIEIDATLDLHGLTAEQARQQLRSFILSAHSRGSRLILVITGKGKKAGYDEFGRPRLGVLKKGVPEWLRGNDLSSSILQVTQAHGRHGGGGAYYVYLRRKR